MAGGQRVAEAAQAAASPEPAGGPGTGAPDEAAGRCRLYARAAALGVAGGCLVFAAAWEPSWKGTVSNAVSALGWTLLLASGHLLVATASEARAARGGPGGAGPADAAVPMTPRAAGPAADSAPRVEGADVGAQADAEGLRRRSQVSTGSVSDGGVDPVWEADWANLGTPEGPPSPTAALARQPVEVFALNDMPTWLARIQSRRDQALRAGKEKLVQKLDKEIADAKKAREAEKEQAAEKEQPTNIHLEPSNGAAVGPPTPEKIRDMESSRCATDGVYGLDWTALGAETTKLQASAQVTAVA